MFDFEEESKRRVPYTLDTQRILLDVGTKEDQSPHPVMLSIDFDILVQKNANIGSYSLQQRESIREFFAFGADEWYTKTYADLRWEVRKQILDEARITYRDVLGIQDNWTAHDLLHGLQEGFDLPSTVYMSDSHAWGFYMLAQLVAKTGKAVHLYHFDTHHDCGYQNDTGTIDSLTAYQSVQNKTLCDDWILAGFAHGLIAKMTMVYPEWRKKEEWQQDFPPLLWKQHQELVHVMTWKEWQKSHKKTRADLMHVVRSSEWTPPWDGNDQMYLDLCQALASTRICLDSTKPYGMTVGSQNATQIRY